MSLNTPAQGPDSPHKHQKVAANEPIRKVLSQPEEEQIVAVQEKKFQRLLQEKKIKQLQGLPENSKATQNTNELYKILQIACSDPEYFFEDNGKLIPDKQSSEHNRAIYKELIDAVVIVPSSLPESFIKQFHIDHIDADAQNIKAIFKEAKPLRYMDQAKGKYTNRVLFHQGKIIIFRTVKNLLFKEDPRTVGEKRKHDTNKYFNTYGSLYDAVRSQEYIIEGQETNANELKALQKILGELILDIKNETKNGEVVRKLDTIKEAIQNATSHHIVAANINNLSAIIGKHPEREKNHLIGAKNKFSKRIADLKSYVATIDIQSNEMNNILHQLEYSTEMLHAGVLGNIAFDGSKNKEIMYAFEKFFEEMAKITYIPEPFAGFLHLFKSLDHVKHRSLEWIYLAVTLQRFSLDIAKTEHALKTGKATYQEISILENTKTIENISGYPKIEEGYGDLMNLLLGWTKELDTLMKNPEENKETTQGLRNLLKSIHSFSKSMTR